MEQTEQSDEKKTRRRQDQPTTGYTLEDGTLIELLYDPRRRAAAFAVARDGAWTVETGIDLENGDRLVPFSPLNNLIRNEVVLLPSQPQEYGSQEELVGSISAFIHRYLDVSATFEQVASYYVLLTWIHDAFNELPYLRLRGDYGSGKTRALLVIGSLCYKAIFASGASTVSPLFHTLDAFRGTLVVDEADFRFSDEKADIIKILNNGNVRGLPVLRTVMNNQREFNPRAFQVFGPKILAARGSFDDRALESRFITEEMGQRRLRRDIPINLPDAHKSEALTLRNKLLLYRFRSLARAGADPSAIDRRLEPRLNQILVPLLSVIDDKGLRDELRQVALGYQETLVADRASSAEADALEVLHELMATNPDSVAVGRVSERIKERFGQDYERPVTPRWVGGLLRRRLRLSTRKVHGIFVVPSSERPKLEVLWERYGIGEPARDTSPDAAGGGGDVGTSG